MNRILQIFDEMIKKIETLLCIQEFIKDRQLMAKYFSDDDIYDLTKYLSAKDLSDETESERISQLIQLLLNSELHLHVDNYKDNVKTFWNAFPPRFSLN